MNKGEIIKSIGGNIDVAIPVDWAMSVRELGINPSHFAWDYREGPNYNKPVNLLETEVVMLRNTIKQLLDKHMEFIEKIESLKEHIRKQEIIS
jgi:hypothetical protein